MPMKYHTYFVKQNAKTFIKAYLVLNYSNYQPCNHVANLQNITGHDGYNK